MRGGSDNGETLYLQGHTLGFVLLLAPIVALAQTQDQPGIDLSTPPPEQARPAQPSAPSAPGAGRTDRGATATDEAPLAPGEADVALGDRVKAVQRKGFLKRHRFELGVDVPATVNDAFYQKVGVGGRLAYHFEDSFALAVRGAKYWQLKTDHVREGQLAFSSQALNSQVYWLAMADGMWSPVYGKIAWLGSRIVHFDMYLLAGFGGVSTATSVAPRNEGLHIAADVGAGVRFYPTSWLALEGGVVATIFPDQPNIGVPSTIQKLVQAQLGLSIFFPFHFEYVYP